MKNIMLRWVVGLFAILITIWAARQIAPVKLAWDPTWHVIVFVPVMAVVNAVVRPVVKLLSMPINCMTLGLFSLIVSALLFWATASLTGALMNFWGALFGSVVYAATSTILSWSIKEKRD
jgi:putative membrane protein